MKQLIALALILILSTFSHSSKAQSNTYTLGTGNLVTSSSCCSPINVRYGSRHSQIVYTKTELNGAGIFKAGNISQLSFEIYQVPYYSLNNFEIKMGHTTASDASSHFSGSLKTIYSASSYQPANTGYDLIVLDTAFFWNGIDNIVLDICHAGNGSLSSSGRIYYTSVSSGYREIATTSSTSNYCNSTTNSAYSYKPNIRLVCEPANTIDLAITAIDTPSIPFSAGNSPVSISLKNVGLDTITTDSLFWTVNGVAQSPKYFTDSLFFNSTKSVRLGSYNFLKDSVYNIKVWSSSPNDSIDKDHSDDTLEVRGLYPGLNGTYTIGGSNPDYASFNAAISALGKGGVAGPVIFNVRNGTYNETLSLVAFNGLSSTNTLTFQSQFGDSSKVVLQKLLTNSPLVDFDGAHYITIKQMTMKAGSGSTQGMIVQMSNGAHHISLLNNHISGINGNSTSTNDALIYMSAGNEDYITIANNYMIYGSYAIYGRGLSTSSLELSMSINGNSIRQPHYRGIYLAYTSGANIIGNHMVTGTSNSDFYGWYFEYCDNGFKFNQNTFAFSGSTVRIASHGVYFNYCDGNSSTPNQYLQNKIILGESGSYAFRFNYCYYGLIANNQLQSAGSASGSTPLYMYQSPYFDVYYNTISNSYSTGSGQAFYGYNNSSLEFKNNIFHHAGGGYACNINGTIPNISDYNCFYSEGNTSSPIYYSGARSLASWQYTYSKDANGISENPEFPTPFNLQTRNYLFDGAGIPVSGVGVDYKGNSRPITNPDIGAFEFTAPANDAGVVSYEAGNTFCDNNNRVYVRIKNFGSDTLTSATLNWEVNGSNQTTVLWTGSLLQGDTSDTIYLGNYAINPGIAYGFAAWTSAPNSATEGHTHNDSLGVSNIYKSLTGSYTIGGSSPDFNTINAAISAIQNGGVCGPVVFNLRNGSYIEDFTISEITGANAGNTITFQSEIGDSSKVTIGKLQTNNALVTLDGAQYISFKKLTLQLGGGSTYGILVDITGTTSNITFKNCQLIGANTNSTSTNDAIVYSNNYNNDDCKFNNNLFKYGSYAIYFYGISSGNKESGTSITNNTFLDQYYYGLSLFYHEAPLIKGNSIISNTPYTSFIALRGEYLDNGMRIDSNYITFTGNTALTNAYGLYLSYCDNKGLILKNRILLGKNAGLRGIYMYACKTGIMANNQIEVGANSSSCEGVYLYDCDAFDIFYNCILNHSLNTSAKALYTAYGGSEEIKNNSFYCENGYYAFFAGNYLPATMDYNNFYSASGTTYIYYSGNNSLSSWQSSYSRDANSISVDPEYESSTNLLPRNFLLDGAGLPVSGVGVDYDGNTRPLSKPDIGAFEFVAPNEDAGISELASNTVMCDSSNGVFIKIKNYGIDTLTSAKVNWTVNGTTQSAYSWSGILAQGSESALIRIGTFNYQIGTAYSVSAWTTSPNNGTEGHNHNDTSSFSDIYLSLSGDYTIGGSNPDFVKIADAITALDRGGVCGPVNFKLRNGTYVESLSIGAIAGASTTNLITFESASRDSSKVTIGKLLTNTPLVVFNNASYIQLKHLSLLVGSGSTFGRLVEFASSTSNITIANCQLIGSATQSTSNNDAILYSGTNQNNYINIINNQIEGGSYGSYLQGTSSSALEDYLNIQNNHFLNQQVAAIENYYQNYTNITNNIIESNSVYSSFAGIYASYVDRLNIIGNSITYTGTNTQASGEGIRLYYCDNSVQVSKNRINFGEGKGLYGLIFQQCNGGLVSNNLVQIGYNSSNTAAAYFYYTSSYDVFYNNFNNTSEASSSAAISMYYETSIELKSNVFASTGNGYAYEILYNFTPTSSDYNGFYAATNSALIYDYGSQYSLSSWASAKSRDQNSIESNPDFISNSNLEVQHFTYDGAGVPVSGVSDDFNGKTRPILGPDIGAHEFRAPRFDAGINEIVESQTLCKQSGGLFVKVENFGRDTLTSATINWSVNGQTQTPYSWTGNLAQGEITNNIKVGNFTFQLDTAYKIITWTSKPNNQSDSLSYNDTAIIGSKYVSLVGNYTIGGSNPDFASIAKAVSALSNGGICGAVTFNIRNGTYNETISLSEIDGSSATNTITFTSQNGDSSKVIITSLLSASKLIDLNGCSYVTFDKISAQMGVGSSNSNTVYIQGNTNNITFSNCQIIGSNTSSTSTNEANIYESSSINNNITLNNNLILYGSYGCYMTGTNSSQREDSLLVNRNTFQDQYYIGIYALYQDAPNIKQNIIQSATTNTGWYGVYLQYCDNGLNVEANTIKNTGTTQLTSSIAIFVYYSDGNSLIHKNRIMYSNGSGYLGIYANRSYQGTIANNLIKLESSNSNNGIYLYDSDNYNVYYNNTLLKNGSSTATCFYTSYSTSLNVKNNIFNNEGNGYCLHYLTYSSFSSLDYNAYYNSNNTNYLRSNNSVYDLSSWQSNFSYDDNSIFEDPAYDTETNLHTTNYLYDDAGIPVSGIGFDIYDSTRSIFHTDIGAYEYIYPATDAGVIEIVSGTFCGAGSNPVKVKIKNFGRDTLTSVTINWKVNGLTQTSYTWKGSLPQGSTSSNITIGSYTFAIGTNYSLEASTSKPNGASEGFAGNDKSTLSTQVLLSGNYTIGNGKSDFTTISAAMSALSAGGVCGPVVFNIKNGTYVEVLSLGEIEGASSTNTITFQSQSRDSSKVIIGKLLSSGAILSLDGTDYITFRDISFQVGSGSTGGYCVLIENEATYNSFLNNRIVGVAATTTSNSFSVIYSDNSLNNYNIFTNNYIKNGSYGIYVQGTSTSSSGQEIGTQISKNDFADQYAVGLSLNYQNAPKINDNYITTGSSYAGWNAIYMQYCYNGSEVKQNRIEVNGTSSYSSGIGIYTTYVDDISISRNRISFGSESGHYGMYMVYLTNAIIDNNEIQVGYNTNTYGIYQYYGGSNNKYYFNSINVDSRYSLSATFFSYYSGGYTFYNNVFANTGSGLCLYVYSSSSSYMPTTSDYNSFFCANSSNFLRYYTYTYSFAVWQSNIGKDANSNFSNPGFPSSTNLRSCNKDYFEKGTAISGFNYDYDGSNRASTGAVNIGAFEFDTAFVVNLGVDTSICNGNTLNLDAGYPRSRYTWSTNDTTQTILVNSGGSYSVKVSNSCGTAHDTIKVTKLNSTLAINLGNDTTICAGDSLNLDAGNANTNASYTWSTNANSQTITANTSGTYQVSVSNACGTLSDSLALTVTSISANAGNDKSITIGNSTGLSGSASGSNAYTYTWTPGNLSGQNITVKPSSTTNYAMKASDLNGCFDYDTVLVTVQGTAVSASLSGDTSICAGESTTLSLSAAGGSGNYKYLWKSNNSTSSSLKVSPSTTKTYKVIFEDANNSSNVDSLAITVKVASALGAPSTTGAQRCGSGKLTLSAQTGTNGNSCRWYTSASGGTLVYTGLSYQTASLTKTINYYVASYDSLTGCESTSRTSVSATINAVPGTVSITNGQRCGNGSIALAVSPGTGATTAKWYAASAGGTALTTSTSYTTPSLSGTTTYYVSSYNASNGCESTSREAIVATVNPVPNSPSLTSGNSCGTGTVKLLASAGTNGNTAIWYSSSSSSIGLDTTTTFNTGSVSTTTTFYASSYNSNTGCESSSRSLASAVINTIPTAPTATANERCGSGTIVLTAKVGSGGTTARWYASSTSNSVLATGTSFTTSNLSSSTNFFVSSYNSTTGCESTSRTKVTATINSIPALPSTTGNERCGAGTLNLSATAGSGGNITKWYSASTGGTALATSANFTTPSLSSTTQYYVSSYNSTEGCESSARQRVDATINSVPATPSLTANSRCGNGALLLSASAGSGANTAIWYSTSSGGSGLDTTTSFNTGSISGTSTYYASSYNTNTGCESTSRTSVLATINSIPGAPSTKDGERCGSGTVSLSATPGTNATTTRWYASNTSTKILTTATGYTTNSLSATTDYYVTSYNATTGCEGTVRTKVTATINPVPLAPSTTGAQQCGSTSSGLTLYASVGSNGNTCKWYTASTGGTLLTTGLSYNTGTISSTTDYYVSSFNTVTNCESSTRTKVTARIGAIPATPVVTNSARCGSGTVKLNAKAGTNGTTCIWYTAASGGTVLDTGLIYTTASLSATKSYFVSSFNTNSGCEGNSRTKITASINAIPGIPVLANNDRCGNGTVSLSGTPDTSGTTLRWYASSNSSSILSTNTNLTTPNITSTTTYYASTYNINTGCESSLRDSATATINSTPSAPTTSGASACGGNSSVTLSASVGKFGNTCRWYSAATGGKLLNTGTSFNTGVISASTDYYVSSYNSVTECESNSRTKVTATIYSNVPSVPSTTSAAICGTGKVNLSAKAGSNANNTKWYSKATGGSALTTGLSFTTATLNSTTTYYVSSYNSSTGCESTTRASVTATINAIPSAPSTTSDARCGVGTVDLKASVGSNGNAVRWYAGPTSSSVLNTGTSFTSTSLSSTATYYASSYNTNTGCEDTTRTAAIATINPVPTAPTATDDSLCGTGSLLLKATTGTNGNTVRWYDASINGKLQAQGSSLQTPSLSSTTTFYITSYNTSTQCETDNRSSVKAIINLVPGIPSTVGDSSCGIGSMKLTGSAGQNGTSLRWYDASSSGNLLITNITYTTNSLSSSTNFYASTYNTITGCESKNRTSTLAKINALPSLASSTSTDTCGSASLVLKAKSGANGNEIRWYNSSVNGTLQSTGFKFNTPTLSTTTNYYVASYNTITGCEASSRAVATATINAIPGAPSLTSDSVCGSGSMTLKGTKGSNGTAIRWYDASINGKLLAQSDDYTTSSLSSTSSYYATTFNVNTGCETQQTSVVKAFVNNIPNKPSLIGAERCDAGSITLSGTAGNGGDSVLWYGANNGGTLLANGSTFKTPNLNMSRKYFASTFSSKTGCESDIRTEIKATINPLPELPTAFADSVCGEGLMTLLAKPGLNGDTCRWYAGLTGGVSLATSESYTTQKLSKTSTYFVSSFNSTTGCESASRIGVDALVHPLPGVPTSIEKSRTGKGSLSLSATTGTNATNVNWYDDPSNGNLIKQALQFKTPILDSTTSYYITSLNEATGCESEPRLEIKGIIYPKPNLAFVVPEVICDGDDINFVNNTTVKEGKLTYLWKFGDGKFSSDKEPKYRYPGSGTYLVSLVVTTENNYTDSVFKFINVNELPNSVFTISNKGSKTLVLIPEDITETKYNWYFGDGNTSAVKIANHRYDNYGFYIIELEVTSEEGCNAKTQHVFDLNTHIDKALGDAIELKAYPNPFTQSSNIEYTLPSTENVTVEAYNSTGQKVATLLNGQQAKGLHQLAFTAATSGIYYIKITVGESVAMMRLVKAN